MLALKVLIYFGWVSSGKKAEKIYIIYRVKQGWVVALASTCEENALASNYEFKNGPQKYYKRHGKKTHWEAMLKCASEKGRLAMVKTEEEYNLVKNMIGKAKQSKQTKLAMNW